MKIKKIYTFVILLIMLMTLLSCGLKNISTQSPLYSNITVTDVNKTNLEFDFSTVFTEKFSEVETTIQKNSNDVVLNTSYYTISGALIDYIGFENFDKWRELCEKLDETSDLLEGDYHANIVSLVEYFKIPREDFQILLDTEIYIFDYNLDVIYSGNRELINEYYSDTEEHSERYQKKSTETSIKSQLFFTVSEEERKAWIKKKNEQWSVKSKTSSKKVIKLRDMQVNDKIVPLYSNEFTGNLRQWSIAEFVAEFDIPKETLEEIINLYKVNNHQMYDYNLDLIYSDDSRIGYMVENSVDALVIDSMYTSSDGIFRDNEIYQATVQKIQNNEEMTVYDVQSVVDSSKSFTDK